MLFDKLDSFRIYPNLYVQRAEDFLKKRKYTDALHAMDKAIEYSPHNKKNKYIFEKIK